MSDLTPSTAPRTATTLHQRIRGDIEARIHSGTWAAGHRLPSEHALMDEYACSRMTVNKVLGLLADAGMIERRRRAGSFVARQHPHLEQVALAIPDIAVEVARRGHAYGFTLLRRRVRNARVHDAMPGARRVLALECVHLADGRPLALEQRLIDIVTVPEAVEQAFEDIAPGSWLLLHVPWTRAEHRISAINAAARQARLLQVATGTACLVIDRSTWRGQAPVTCVRQAFLGSAYDLVARFAPGRR